MRSRNEKEKNSKKLYKTWKPNISDQQAKYLRMKQDQQTMSNFSDQKKTVRK